MFGKTPITALQEYCAKKNIARPVYEFEEAPDGSKSFVCIVEALGEMAEGIGRSKKEAKHDASANIIKRLKRNHPDIEDIPQAPHEAIPTSDAIADLRDLCIQQDHPLPHFEIVQQAGPPEAPEFTAECKVATITRYATASTKKGAKQLAAQEIIRIIRNISAVELVSNLTVAKVIDKEVANEKEANQKKIKTYREFVESDIKVCPGILLCNRHNYFKKFPNEIKKKVQEIMTNSMILSDKEKLDLILKELNIKYKIEETSALVWGSMLTVEFLSDYDAFFCGIEESLFGEILEYLNNMLF